jgi:cell division protein FtsI (penicillin-binding protein 3)
VNVRSTPNRLLIVAALLTLWTGSAMVRLGYLQLVRYGDFMARAEHQQQHIVEISPKRADILDRNLRALAMSASVDSCFAIPSEIADPELVARLLSRVLNVSQDEIETRLAASHSFAWIARKLPPETAERIEALNLKGIYFQKEDQRFYPKRDLAASVLGYVDIDEKGIGGIEYGLDDRIRSKPGRMLISADAHSRWYDSSDKAPDEGTSVVLTIDQNIQFIAEKELATAIGETHAKAGSVIVQDPSNGEILAMANWPTFNPNAPGETTPEARMNRAVAALYEPGSVFKIVTLSAAIDQGLTNPNEVVDCQNGAIYIAGHRIRDHKPYGLLTVSQILAKSSDVGAIKIGLRLGAPKLYDYIRAYGFGAPTGIDLPGESRGLLRRLDNWTPVSVGSISMGQEVGVTPVQIITAMSAIANGGLLYRPHVVMALRKGSQETPLTEDEPDPRRVIRPTTAATMRAMLEGVVLNGTATRAQLDGYTAAGKTGTAQKIDPSTGRYSETQLIASFVGFAPINNPAVTILVQLDSPVGPHEGGAVAAPVFKRVAEQVLAYRNVPHDIPLSAKTQLAGKRAAKAASDDDVADFNPVQTDAPAIPGDDTSDSVASNAGGVAGNVASGAVTASVYAASLLSSPAHTKGAPSAKNPQAAGSAPTAELADGAGVPVPSFAGKTVREVTQLCVQMGLNPVLIGSGAVQQQEPQAGATLRRGGAVTVWFGGAPTLVNAHDRKLSAAQGKSPLARKQ